MDYNHYQSIVLMVAVARLVRRGGLVSVAFIVKRFKLLIKPGRNRKTVHETSSATVERNLNEDFE
jgi:hypothetical protein